MMAVAWLRWTFKYWLCVGENYLPSCQPGGPPGGTGQTFLEMEQFRRLVIDRQALMILLWLRAASNKKEATSILADWDDREVQPSWCRLPEHVSHHTDKVKREPRPKRHKVAFLGLECQVRDLLHGLEHVVQC